MIKTPVLNLIPGDEVEIDGEMWEVRHHILAVNNDHPVQMRLVACADRSRGKTVLTSLLHPYKRALRDNEEPYYGPVRYLGMTENGEQYTP